MEKMSRVTTALSGSALTGRTMHCHLDAPANAISVCRDAAQVVVAGRSIFKIYAIEEEQFVEKLNLRVGRKPSLNLSCADVVWHQMDENLLATAATNGVVVTWNLGRPSRNKQDQLFTEHKRTVNKVCFHPTEAHVLLSGSQDGFMKCFDLRRKDSVSTFSGEALGGESGRCASLQAPGLSRQVGKCRVHHRPSAVLPEGFLEKGQAELALEEWVEVSGGGRGRPGGSARRIWSVLTALMHLWGQPELRLSVGSGRGQSQSRSTATLGS